LAHIIDMIKQRRQHYLYRVGQAGEIVRLDRAPTPEELAAFATAGLAPARLGQRYEQVCFCPVNGDASWIPRRFLLGADGEVVGSIEDWE